ncbi:alpha/beta hydrolase [Sinomonas sp. ASV322]|uniref:alpha/beta hydrolase n=1 Tax=Sinomonas sp. ASV322 TaxID=3041920 RepID=UPI0027DD7CC9|nr:alpha/beta hydrolase [Sinomonas sp. ASV322]MDQ4502378.1 alpha/beta hydrolase [Sinomonas sp. ASV322]
MSEFVLIHGAGTGAWLWDDFAEVLRGRGHEVLAPSLVGVGERISEGGPATRLSDHIDQVCEVIGVHRVTVVGFSYGGLVAAGVGERIPDQISMLVYLDAFLPVDGMSMFDLLPVPVRDSIQAAAEATGDGWRIPPMPLDRLGGIGSVGEGVDGDKVVALLSRRGPHPIGTYREVMTVRNPATQTIPRVYITCTEHPANDPMSVVTERARADGMPVYDIDTGHFPMLTKPIELADLLERLV